ncbi:hypothetical protein, conserved [Trypanosoma brucei gambiense DAL972]|uniref:RNA-editing substrate-binding complex 6 protein domain-containing protein n=1 Tax=Trypanosoma brucei gambiense (strain MHOM/CI/86/DAL972) TaxID=679716 RepID=C9ZQP3_TRYB9|nr:hypothetical protein, conserved [Trypanosoma brucei gambiense DAL972]CBH11723.1 hypothetical protein, conserved [Trypanosoma brucei gambiense DAL972]|eukprot:XP_011774008.1 hypothetical protein, conserved [Trypanosoma brucei gambiense DAL972]
MLRPFVGRIGPLGGHGHRRMVCSTICLFQRGQWGNEGSRGDQRNYDNRGGRGEWGDRGGQRGGNQRDYGDQRNYDNRGGRGEWGDRGGQRGDNQRDYGDQRNYDNRGGRGEWGDRGGQRGGNQRDYGDQRNYDNRGGRGEWGDRGGQRGDNQRDYGDQRNYDNRGGRGEWGDRGGQRGGNQRDNSNQFGYRNERDGGIGRQRSARDNFGAHDNRASDERGSTDPAVGEVFDEQAAKILYELKRRFKSSKTGKERRDVQREARRIVRRARVDPSTQDEKSVTLLLNCAATFRCYPHTEGIKQATEWMRKNIDGLSPQNVALFTNAIGALSVVDSDTILINEISPAVEACYGQMNPVELVMTLQAFQRGRITENEDLQVSLLQQLVTCVPQMPAPQLSTLAGVLVDTPLRKRDEATWQEIAKTVVSKAASGAENMHSREVITLLKATPRLGVPEDHSFHLVDRAIATVGFHTDEQIGELLEAVSYYRDPQKTCGRELNEKLDKLVDALWARLQKVAPFADAASVTTIMRAAHRSGIDVPRDIVSTLVQAVMRELRYHRFTFRRVASLSEALALQKVPAKELLAMLGDYCIGKRPPREERGENTPVDDHNSGIEERMDIYARFLGDLTKARIALENAHSSNAGNGEPGSSVSQILAQRLEDSVGSAPPRELLKSVRAICTAADDCPFRNRANDGKIIALSEQRIAKEGASFMEGVRKTTMENFLSAVSGIPQAQKVVEVLSHQTR